MKAILFILIISQVLQVLCYDKDIANAFVSMLDGNFTKADSIIKTINRAKIAQYKKALATQNWKVGLDTKKYIPKSGVWAAYTQTSTAANMFLNGQSQKADKFFNKAVSIIKPVLDIHDNKQYIFLNGNVIVPYDKYLPIIKCGASFCDIQHIFGFYESNEVITAFNKLRNQVRATPLNIPPKTINENRWENYVAKTILGYDPSYHNEVSKEGNMRIPYYVNLTNIFHSDHDTAPGYNDYPKDNNP